MSSPATFAKPHTALEPIKHPYVPMQHQRSEAQFRPRHWPLGQICQLDSHWRLRQPPLVCEPPLYNWKVVPPVSSRVGEKAAATPFERRTRALLRIPAVKKMIAVLGANIDVVQEIFSDCISSSPIRHATIISPGQAVMPEQEFADVQSFVLIVLTESHLHYFSLSASNINHKSCRLSEIMFESTYYISGSEIDRMQVRCMSSEYVGGVYVSLPEAYFVFSGPIGIEGAREFLRKFSLYREVADEKAR